MIQHVWSVLSQSGAFDEGNGHASIFDILEHITILRPPEKLTRFPIRFEIYSLWARSNPQEPANGSMRVTVQFPDEVSKSLVDDLPLDLSKSFFHRTRIHSDYMVIKDAGIYRFNVDLKSSGSETWINVASIPLEITFESSAPDQDINR